MKKTRAQKDYQKQMKALERSGSIQKKARQSWSFRETRLYYYGSRILLIVIIMWLIAQFDMAFYNIVNMFR